MDTTDSAPKQSASADAIQGIGTAAAATTNTDPSIQTRQVHVNSGTLLHGLFLMQQRLDMNVATTRTNLFITKCLQARLDITNDIEGRHKAARENRAKLRSEAAKRGQWPSRDKSGKVVTGPLDDDPPLEQMPVLWFDVPLASLTTLQYCRFVYCFINDAFNYAKLVGQQQETGEKKPDGSPVYVTTNTSACTREDAAKHFAWFHAINQKLMDFLMPLCTPLSANVATAALDPTTGKPDFYETIRQNLRETQTRFEKLLRATIAKALVAPHHQATDEQVENMVRLRMYRPLHGYDETGKIANELRLRELHSKLAKELDVSIGLVHLLHLWALDVANDERRHKRLATLNSYIDAGIKEAKTTDSTEAPVTSDELDNAAAILATAAQALGSSGTTTKH